VIREVRVLRVANGDLQRISDSIRIRVSDESAKRWNSKLLAAIEDLAISADQHPEADEALVTGRDVRMRIVGKYRHFYRILFSINAGRVIVHRVRHAAQDTLTEDDF